MKTKELAKDLKEHIGCGIEVPLYDEELEVVVEALEKQIAKKPRKIEAEGYRYTDTYRCPTCGGNFSGTGIADYCYHCGQKLDWSEIDE